MSIFSVSIGTYTSEGLMESLASDTGGKYEVIIDDSQLVSALSSFYKQFNVPLASGLNIEYTNALGSIYPSNIGSAIFNGSEILQTGLYENELTIEVSFSLRNEDVEYSLSASEPGNELRQIERIWSAKRIDYLLSRNLVSQAEEISREIIGLAMYYGLVVPGYTGMILVIDDQSEEDTQGDVVQSYTDIDPGYNNNNRAPGAKYSDDASTPVFGFFAIFTALIVQFFSLRRVRNQKTIYKLE